MWIAGGKSFERRISSLIRYLQLNSCGWDRDCRHGRATGDEDGLARLVVFDRHCDDRHREVWCLELRSSESPAVCQGRGFAGSSPERCYGAFGRKPDGENKGPKQLLGHDG